MEKELPAPEENIRDLFHSAVKNLPDLARVPIATYRLQFNHQFKFLEAQSIIPYLSELGISDCYASPYFMANKGSPHGYDIVNHDQLNPEIGTDEEYDAFVGELRKYEMGQVLDIVPNHMSIAGNENDWWMEVLENGPSSVYADFFDIDWNPVKDDLRNKVLLPILGGQYGQVLENQELNLSFQEGAFFIRYGERKLPVDPASYTRILKLRIDDLEKEIGKDHPQLQELLSVLTALTHLPARGEKDSEKRMERRREKEVIKRRLGDLYNNSGEIRSFIDENLLFFNGEKNNPRSFDLLDDLLNDQAYRLSHWRVATDEINYRRFFDINELAAIRVEDPRVFGEVHQFAFKLIREGKVTGLRVDHPDGLYNPVEYFYRLQRGCFVQLCFRSSVSSVESVDEEEVKRLYDEALFKNLDSPLRTSFYIVGEKILTKGERIPEDWPISGTIGYAFMASLNGIFVDTENAKKFDEIYSRFIGSKLNYQDLVYEKKKLIMVTTMSSEINALGHFLDRISEKNRHTRDFTLNSLTAAIIEAIACFPVYRTYVNSCGVIERDRRYIEQAVTRAKRKNPAVSATTFDFLQDVLLLKSPDDLSEPERAEWLDFVMKFQQVTGPVMAKGLEDTVFYVYNRLVSLNEVGGSPERFGITLDTFHGQNIERVKSWPGGLSETSTHDTKRSEDVRARLNVLSEIPDEWRHHVARWSRINNKKKFVVEGQVVPDRNEEYLFYQTLLGAWPIRPMNGTEYEGFQKRIKDFMLKAVREAKVNSSWISPNTPYEDALLKFVDGVTSRPLNNPFVQDFDPFRKKVSYCGMFNSLSQTTLKITSPGTPDFYQGTEVWDFSLVDPDNRRPVNFELRRGLLRALKEKMALSGSDLSGFARGLLREWEDGSIKLYVIFRSLNYRKENRQVFTDGAYISLQGDGDLQNHICAFARQWEGKVVLVIVPRFLTRLVESPDELPLGHKVWRDSWLVLPPQISAVRFKSVFTAETIETVERDGRTGLALDQVFAYFPVALLETS
ncbi:MAG TPA: malto-oligosyltrehalose synthase [Thermodesulfobacteriota bacterium]|nr:malto-oligosyltrehalose synthase [Thermodesulfobacteriota bacterium]